MTIYISWCIIVLLDNIVYNYCELQNEATTSVLTDVVLFIFKNTTYNIFLLIKRLLNRYYTWYCDIYWVVLYSKTFRKLPVYCKFYPSAIFLMSYSTFAAFPKTEYGTWLVAHGNKLQIFYPVIWTVIRVNPAATTAVSAYKSAMLVLPSNYSYIAKGIGRDYTLCVFYYAYCVMRTLIVNGR